jgi:type IV pilus assembly protein PilO
MKLRLSKFDRLMLIFGTLLLILLIVIGQFVFLSPLKSELETKKQSLESEQKLLDVMNEKKEDDTAKITEDTKELQKKVPVSPLQEQLIFDLERAENVSNSKITSMGFSTDADVTMEATQTDGANTEAGQTPETTSGTTPENTTDTAANQQATPATSSGLKKLTVSLSVESPTYEELEKFIGTLENLNRIVVVESINYSGGQEVTSLVAVPEKISYSLNISAYYLPTLEDLIADLPKIDAPAPANKKNPLSTFSDTTSAN